MNRPCVVVTGGLPLLFWRFVGELWEAMGICVCSGPWDTHALPLAKVLSAPDVAPYPGTAGGRAWGLRQGSCLSSRGIVTWPQSTRGHGLSEGGCCVATGPAMPSADPGPWPFVLGPLPAVQCRVLGPKLPCAASCPMQ